MTRCECDTHRHCSAHYLQLLYSTHTLPPAVRLHSRQMTSWLLRTVGSHVTSQVGALGELLAADCTLVRLLPGVSAKVHL